MQIISKDKCRNLLLAGDINEFRRWLLKLGTRKASILLRAIDEIANRPADQLLQIHRVWRYESGTNPKIYVLCKGQIRLYCCMKGDDIFILTWGLKQGKKADAAILRLAIDRAKEILK